MIPNILTIAGTDPTGGAGIQADLKTFSALGAYGMSVITAVVAQNTREVRGFVALEPGFVADQLAAVFEDVRVDAVKIGMVANAGIAEAIAVTLDRYARCPVVLDPVMIVKSGDHLLEQDAVDAIRGLLVPRSTIITPNLPEASVLLKRDTEIADLACMRDALGELNVLGSEWALLKGGHLGSGDSVGMLVGGEEMIELAAARIGTVNDHGAGCTLSAVIAALLPSKNLETAVRLAKGYLTDALRHAEELDVGAGHGPVHHFYALWEN